MSIAADSEDIEKDARTDGSDPALIAGARRSTLIIPLPGRAVPLIDPEMINSTAIPEEDINTAVIGDDSSPVAHVDGSSRSLRSAQPGPLPGRPIPLVGPDAVRDYLNEDRDLVARDDCPVSCIQSPVGRRAFDGFLAYCSSRKASTIWSISSGFSTCGVCPHASKTSSWKCPPCSWYARKNLRICLFIG